ncbi:acylphosphatase [Guyparkeria hydrothermalis]|uniref:acylphosphatase n=1 Tax=Guyparkeria TaxID=2035712 RepID=UPI0010ABDE00|nr:MULTISPECIES: acylphosphatase [Guyparkeria]MCL7751117.1 acylphosphatase [Guyparkeria hydrothermalis]TKA89932.1 acylphosphatase [Guyparkeria sp. SB14A]
MTDTIRRHVHVSGRVQGVFFRDFTRQQAEALGVAGWVRNLDDGRVEAVLEGDADVISTMLERLRDGPRHARVTDLAVREEPVEGLTSFAVTG